LYMAPELLQDSTKFSTKCDVYAYGIMAWEALEDKTPYTKHSGNLEQLKKFVCEGKGRPNEDSPLRLDNPLHAFYQKTWDQEPNKRYSFEELSVDLTNAPWSTILALWLSDDKRNIKIWSDAVASGGGKADNDTVKFEHFLDQYASVMETRGLFNMEKPPPLTQALAAIMNVDLNLKSPTVKKDDWFRLFNWFAPISNKTAAYVHELVTKPWFFGQMTQFDANNRLMFSKPGTFLVRFSATVLGKFTVSYVGKVGNSNQVVHTRLEEACVPSALAGWVESRKKLLKFAFDGPKPPLYAAVLPLPAKS